MEDERRILIVIEVEQFRRFQIMKAKTGLTSKGLLIKLMDMMEEVSPNLGG